MGWDSGYMNLGGLCGAGEFFDSSIDISSYGGDWRQIYNEFITYNKGVPSNDGQGGMFGGLYFSDFRTLNDGQTYEVFRLRVNRDDVRREIVCKGVYRAQYSDFGVTLYIRVYTDATNYTDTPYSNWPAFSCVTGWYPSGGFNEQTQEVNAVFTTTTVSNVKYVLYGLVQQFYVPWQGTYKYCWDVRAIEYSEFENWAGGEIEPIKESAEFGKPARKKGGYNRDHHKKGTFDDHSDLIAPTALPTEGVSVSGFINVYEVNRSALEQLGDLLFPQPSDFIEAIANRYLTDYIVGCKLIPCKPSSTGGGNIIRVGYKSQHIESPGNVRQVESDWVEIDLGEKGLAEYWANFLDYSGTRAKLFLPFYGFVDLEPEFWNGGGKVHIVYRINVIDGSFIAMIRSKSGMSELNDSLIAQYSGNCGIDIPITGVQYGNMLTRMTQGVAQIGMSAVTGNMNGALSSLGNLASLKPDVPKSNGYSGNAGFMGHRRPFFLIERQVSQFSEKYPSEVGLPYYAMETIKNCSGLVIASKAHLDTIPCSIKGKETIARLLADGIIV